MQRIEIDLGLLRQMCNDNVPTKDIAAAFGCSLAVIHRRLKRLGLNRRCGEMKDWQQKYPDSTVIELYKEHRSLNKVGAIVGCTGKTVWNILEKNGVARRQKGASGVDHPGWKGGKTVDGRGYIRVHSPDHPYAVSGYVPEHRLVMEAHIGRYLNPEEEVHHKDHNKTNNNIDNLELFENSSDHMRAHHACRSRIDHALSCRKQRNDKILDAARPILLKLVNEQRHSPRAIGDLADMPAPFLGSWCRRAGCVKRQGNQKPSPVTPETLELVRQLSSILRPLVRGAKKCKQLDVDTNET